MHLSGGHPNPHFSQETPSFTSPQRTKQIGKHSELGDNT